MDDALKKIAEKLAMTSKGGNLYKLENCVEFYTINKGNKPKNPSKLRTFLRDYMTDNFWTKENPSNEILDEFLVVYNGLFLVQDFTLSSVTKSSNDFNLKMIENFLNKAKAYKEKKK